MTKAYKAYLAEKHAEEEHMELVTLKHKLEYQRQHYGEVDKYDFDEYMRLIQQSYAK